MVVTRSSNQFGPYQFPEKLIPFFVTSLLDGRQVPLYGDGLNVRDWLFVRDNCEGVDLVLREGTVGEIYNIGAGNERTNREITDRLLAILGKDESCVEYVEDRLGHDRRYSIATDKVAALGLERRRRTSTTASRRPCASTWTTATGGSRSRRSASRRQPVRARWSAA